MKIMSFNINGLRARLHQLQAIIDKHQPDVIGLQEIKVHNDEFPLKAVEEMGYHVYFHGQKAHYGVAVLCKEKAINVQYGFPTDTDEMQKRMLIVSVLDKKGEPVHILNGYFPQGENQKHETKYPYKRQFFNDLNVYLNDTYKNTEQVIVMGDINIAPIDLDIGIGEANAKRWLKTTKCCFLPEEREWFAKLMNFGFTDTFRLVHPDVSDRYSWFDYRSRGFDTNRGLRIDVILATKTLADKTKDSGIDYELRAIEKPSDHAPIWTTFE